MNSAYDKIIELLWEGSFDPKKKIEAAKRRELNRIVRASIRRQKKTSGAGNTREGAARTASQIRLNPPKDLGKTTPLSKKERDKMRRSIAAVGAGLEVGYSSK